MLLEVGNRGGGPVPIFIQFNPLLGTWHLLFSATVLH